LSKVPTYDIKNLNAEPAKQDLEEFMVAQENLLDLSTIISRDLTEVIEEDDSYIKVYLEPKII
jgi:tRNA A58 N-methylase Trm61